MFEVGKMFANGGMCFKIIELHPKTCKIQFIDTHYVTIVQKSQISNSEGHYGKSVYIHDPFAFRVKGVARLGISTVPHNRDRKDRVLTKAVDTIWPLVVDDYINGIEVPESWLTKSSFEEWFVEDYGDRWQEFVDNDKRLLPLVKHGRKISVFVDKVTYKKWRLKSGVFKSGRVYRALFMGDVLGTRGKRIDALNLLLKHVKELELPQPLRVNLDTRILALEQEIGENGDR